MGRGARKFTLFRMGWVERVEGVKRVRIGRLWGPNWASRMASVL